MVELKGVTADLSTKTSVAEYQEFVSQELEQLDIGVVCLNAGCCVTGPIDMTSDADFERVFGLNALHVVYLIKALLPKQMQREQKSSILVVSSLIAYIAMPGVASYSATKAMVSNFTEALSFEVREKIDVTCWEPGPCDTNIFPNGESPAIKLTPRKAVSDVLCQLGKTRLTMGSYIFYLFGSMFPPLGWIGNKAADSVRRKTEYQRRQN